MKDFAAKLYKSKAWQRCREAYARSRGYLCERCAVNGILKAGEIVHHKIYITPANVSDPTVTLNPDNLELLCRDCHAQEHTGVIIRWNIDEFGRVEAR